MDDLRIKRVGRKFIVVPKGIEVTQTFDELWDEVLTEELEKAKKAWLGTLLALSLCEEDEERSLK